MNQSNRLGLLRHKVGMTRFFTDDDESVPVTVVDVSNNRVTQVKTQENDGYVAIQVTFGSRRPSPPRKAANSFSFKPPIGKTSPRRVTSTSKNPDAQDTEESKTTPFAQ